MTISKQDRDRISAAIQAAEEKTSGEIVCVLARSSCDATALPILLAAVAALALPWALVAFSALSIQRILLLQLLTFLVVGAILCLPPVRIALVPRRARRAAAHRVATQQFFQHRIARKAERSGIMIFVSLAEHYARVIVDEGVAGRVPQSTWQHAVDSLIEQARDGRIADGFIAAVDICGQVLATHFPGTGTSPRDELPDRLYII